LKLFQKGDISLLLHQGYFVFCDQVVDDVFVCDIQFHMIPYKQPLSSYAPLTNTELDIQAPKQVQSSLVICFNPSCLIPKMCQSTKSTRCNPSSGTHSADHKSTPSNTHKTIATRSYDASFTTMSIDKGCTLVANRGCEGGGDEETC
jgi:hypothetical protein